LLNKSKKIIDKIENINSVNNISSEVGKHSKTLKNEKKSQKVLSKKIKAGEIKKNKKLRTLWVRKKKAS